MWKKTRFRGTTGAASPPCGTPSDRSRPARARRWVDVGLTAHRVRWDALVDWRFVPESADGRTDEMQSLSTTWRCERTGSPWRARPVPPGSVTGSKQSNRWPPALRPGSDLRLASLLAGRAGPGPFRDRGGRRAVRRRDRPRGMGEPVRPARAAVPALRRRGRRPERRCVAPGQVLGWRAFPARLLREWIKGLIGCRVRVV